MLAAYSAGQWLSGTDEVIGEELVNYSECNPQKNNCEIKIENNYYVMSFRGDASPLVPFSVFLDVKKNSLSPDSVVILFDMADMDMGFNQYQLLKNKNRWQANVILPVCSLGKNDWELKVKMTFESDVRVTQFSFSQSDKK